MNAGLGLTMTMVVSLGLSLALVQVIKAPLRQVINALCSSGEATQFWVSFTSLMLYIAPLFSALFSFDPESQLPAVIVLRGTLLATLFGASAALIVVGIRIASASPKSRDPVAH